MSLFQILKNNSTVEVEQKFLRESIDSKTQQQDKSEVIRRRFISMLYYGGYLTIRNIQGKNVILGPPNLTVYQNILTFFNNLAPMRTLNQKLNLLCRDSIQVTNKVWQDSLIALCQMQAGVNLYGSTKYEKSRQLNLTSNIQCALQPHLEDFRVYHQRQTKDGKKPDIIIAQKSTKKPIIVLQYLISDHYSIAQLRNHVDKNYQDQYRGAKEQITVLVDRKDMKTILIAKRKRKGSNQEEFIIDTRETK